MSDDTWIETFNCLYNVTEFIPTVSILLNLNMDVFLI